MQQAGVASRMLVQKKTSNDDTVLSPSTALSKIAHRARRRIGHEISNLHTASVEANRSLNLIPSLVHRRINRLNPKVVHLHWVGEEMISIAEVARINAPIVWTLHDMWAFSASSHYGPESTDGVPPSNDEGERTWFDPLVRWQKQRHWQDLDVTVVTPSRWLAREARRSVLFADKCIRSIPNGIDTDVYKPVPKEAARTALNLPQDARLILFGAVKAFQDRRKGGKLLQEVLYTLTSEGAGDTHLVVFGASDGPRDFNTPVHYLGSFQDDVSLSLLYSACDVFVAPSRQDNLPNTIMEAMACGTPCVAFKVGGIQEMIDHKTTGYLAPAFDVDAMTYGIRSIICDRTHADQLGQNARAKVCRHYALPRVVSAYRDVYSDVCR